MNLTFNREIITPSIVEDPTERLEHKLLSNSHGAVYLQQVFSKVASDLLPEYTGGFWEFYNLSNGGAFLALSSDEHYSAKGLDIHRVRLLNGYYAGFYITLVVLQILLNQSDDNLKKYAKYLLAKNEPFLYQINDGNPNESILDLYLACRD